jgi:hypothetical protein
MHKLCFQRVGWCKVCQNPYNIIQRRPNATTSYKEEARYSILKGISSLLLR